MVQESKKQVVKEYTHLFEQYPIVASLNLMNLPAKQLQDMRAQLRETMVLKCGKRRLMKLAIEDAKNKKQGLEQLIPHLKGIPALLFTQVNPFSLYKTLDKSKSTAAAKPGQIATKDIVIPAGPTSFAPGPIIGELGALGIKAGIEAGKVVVKQDCTVVHEGDVINEKVASVLLRFGIEPMEIGLNLTAVYEKGLVYEGKVLAIDEKEYVNNIIKASSWAFNLAVEAAYPTKETRELLVQKAFREAKAVALEAGVPAEGVVEDLVARAEQTAQGLKQELSL